MTAERKKDLIRALKFFLFSVSAGVVQIASFTLLNEVIFVDGGDFGYWFSYLVALILSVIWNFTFNRRFTFKSAANVPIAMLLVFAFYAVFAPLSTLLEWWLCDLNGWNEYLVLAINMVLILLLNSYIKDMSSSVSRLTRMPSPKKTKRKQNTLLKTVNLNNLFSDDN